MGNTEDADQQRRSRRATDARERVARSLQRAFPLPDSGEFNDLLAALGSSRPTR